MQHISVSSSNLKSVGYDAKQQLFEIEFLNGRRYQYLGVPNSVYQELMNASSHGIYFNAHIKGIYSYVPV